MPPVFQSNFAIRQILDNKSEFKINAKHEKTARLPNYKERNGVETALSGDDNRHKEKPLYTFSAMIVMAIRCSPEQRLPLNAIQEWICINFPFYQRKNPGWQSQVRHTLSTNSCFIKVPRPAGDPGRGSYWTISPTVADVKINAATGRLQIHTYSHFVPMNHHSQAIGGAYTPTGDFQNTRKMPQAYQEQCEYLPWYNWQHAAQRLQQLQMQKQRQQLAPPSMIYYDQMYPHLIFH